MIKIKKIQINKREFEGSQREFKKWTRIHIFVTGENVLENLFFRRNRPQKLYREKVLPDVLKETGIDPNAEITWSQTAGCSCGCSPGFIVKGYNTFDVYVDVEATNEEDKISLQTSVG